MKGLCLVPPRPKYTRAEIIQAAFHLTEKQGIDALTARSIALEMDYTCSSLFTHFKSMEELRQEVFALAKQTMIDYLTECVHYQPAFKEFGLRWVRFARDHGNLYQLLWGHGSELIRNPKNILPALGTLVPTVMSGIMQSFDFTEKEAMELLTQMLIHGNGIAAFIISGYRNLT